MNIKDEILFELNNASNKNYQEFSSILIPNIEKKKFLGVRIPFLRKYAKKLAKTKNIDKFLSALPHEFQEENMLHAFILEQILDFNKCIDYIEKFLPFIDNWAVCDGLHPKCFKNNLDSVFTHVLVWIKSSHPYTKRFAINTLMTYFLDEHFEPAHIQLVVSTIDNDYYVNMMRAWYFATALVKQYDATIPILENRQSDKWTHNKTIQKACESLRISSEIKEYLKSLKVK